jgi:hydrogenase maturation protein HypF
LFALGRGAEIAGRFGKHAGAPLVAQMLARGVHCVPTTSAGRVFDAAAAMLGIAELNRHESEAAMALEATANTFGAALPWADAWHIQDDNVLDLRPLLERMAMADGSARARAEGAARFHATFAAAVADWSMRLARRQRFETIALAGGCFLNRRLRHDVVARLRAGGFTVLEPVAAPPSDGGIALGQAWIGLQSL